MVYYKEGGNGEAFLTHYEGASGYIDFSEAFTTIKNQSSGIAASSSRRLEVADLKDFTFDGQLGKVLEINAGENTFISEEAFNACDFIVISVDNGVNDFVIKESIITIDSSSISIGCEYNEYVPVNDSKKAVLLKNGGAAPVIINDGNGLKNIISENRESAGQFMGDGMKLIWNFPVATEVLTKYLPGHIVAPNAKVTSEGDNFESSIIAAEVVSHGEGHFYPFYGIGETPTPEPTQSTEELARNNSPDFPNNNSAAQKEKLPKTGGAVGSTYGIVSFLLIAL